MAVEGPGAERGFVTAAPSKLQGLTEKQRLDYLQVQCPHSCAAECVAASMCEQPHHGTSRNAEQSAGAR